MAILVAVRHARLTNVGSGAEGVGAQHIDGGGVTVHAVAKAAWGVEEPFRACPHARCLSLMDLSHPPTHQYVKVTLPKPLLTKSSNCPCHKSTDNVYGTRAK